MNKFIVLFFTFALVSCYNKDIKKKELVNKNPHLIQNSVTVFIPEELWNGSVGKYIRTNFAAPIIGLQEHESLFTLLPVHTRNFSSESKQAKNVLFIGLDFQSRMQHETNKYVSNQHVFSIQGKNEAVILQQLETSVREIRNTFYNSELNLVLSKNNLNRVLYNQIKNKFKINIQIPTSYKIGLQGDDFMWLRKEVGSGYNNLLIYTASFSAIYNLKPVVTNSLFIRNKVAKKYVLGKTTGSYMISEPAYYPTFHTTKIQNTLAYEMRGTWEFHNDFMTGPYVNFAIRDGKRKRFIIIDGFAYNPIRTKKEMLFEMEAIIKSTKIL